MTLTFKADLFVTIISRLTTALVTLLSVRIMTTYLSPNAYAEFALFISIQMFCGLFLINPVGQYLNRHIHVWWQSNEFLYYLKLYNYYIFVVSCIGGFLAALLNFYKFNSDVVVVFIILFLLIYSTNWNATLVPGLNLLGFRVSSSILAVLSGLSGLGGAILLMEFSTSSIFWILGQSIGALLGALIAMLALYKFSLELTFSAKHKTSVHKSDLYSFCIPIAISTFFLWVQMSGYRFAIEALWNANEFAYVVVGLTIASQLSALFESFIQQYLYPRFYKGFSEASRSEAAALYSDLMNSVGPICLVYSAALILGAFSITGLMVSSSYSSAAHYVQFGVLIEVFRVLGNLFSNAAQITKNTRALIFPNIIGAAVLMGLFPVLYFYNASIDYACYVLLIAACANFMVTIFLMLRLLPFSIDYTRWLIAMIFFMIAVFASFWWRPTFELVYSFLYLLCLGGLSLCSSYLLLANNSAFKRLLNIKFSHEISSP